MRNLMLIVLLGLFVAACAPQASNDASSASEAPAEPAPIEFADSKYVDMAKAGLPAMTNKDMAAFTSNMADDGLYIFNNGDTLRGKAEITDYWNGRMEVINSISFSNDVWLSLKVNDSQNVTPGNWVLGWFDVAATYTSGNSMSQNVHTLYHYNDNDQVDIVIQYIDRLAVMQAQSAE